MTDENQLFRINNDAMTIVAYNAMTLMLLILIILVWFKCLWNKNDFS